jgi:hypothetical protein
MSWRALRADTEPFRDSVQGQALDRAQAEHDGH